MSVPRYLLFVSFFLFVELSYAQVANEVNYQGRLREFGYPASGNRTMSFKIYNVSSGGIPLWSSGDVSVSVSSGVFSYTLSPLIDWRTGNFWLETTVAGQVYSPRQKLTSQFFALEAKSAEAVSVSTGTIFFSIGLSTYAVLTPNGLQVFGNIILTGSFGTIDISTRAAQWDSTYASVVGNTGNWNNAYSHKTAEDSINGIVKVNGLGGYSAVTDNSNNWNTAYSDRLKWDGGSSGLDVNTARTSLGLGDLALRSAGSITNSDISGTADISGGKISGWNATNWDTATHDVLYADSANTPSSIVRRSGDGDVIFRRVYATNFSGGLVNGYSSSYSFGTDYTAATDILVIAYITSTSGSTSGNITGYYGNPSPTTIIAIASCSYSSNVPSGTLTYMVKKGDHWKVTMNIVEGSPSGTITVITLAQ